MHFAIIVFPVPGGPNNSIAFGSFLKPVNISGRSIGQTIDSLITDLGNSRPAMSFHSNYRNIKINNLIEQKENIQKMYLPTATSFFIMSLRIVSER